MTKNFECLLKKLVFDCCLTVQMTSAWRLLAGSEFQLTPGPEKRLLTELRFKSWNDGVSELSQAGGLSTKCSTDWRRMLQALTRSTPCHRREHQMCTAWPWSDSALEADAVERWYFFDSTRLFFYICQHCKTLMSAEFTELDWSWMLMLVDVTANESCSKKLDNSFYKYVELNYP